MCLTCSVIYAVTANFHIKFSKFCDPEKNSTDPSGGLGPPFEQHCSKERVFMRYFVV